MMPVLRDSPADSVESFSNTQEAFGVLEPLELTFDDVSYTLSHSETEMSDDAVRIIMDRLRTFEGNCTYLREIGLDRYLEEAGSLVPKIWIQEALRCTYAETQQQIPPEHNPAALTTFDDQKPVHQWVQPKRLFESIKLNPSREAYRDVLGKPFFGPNNVTMSYERVNRKGEKFTQWSSTLSNHGESGYWRRYARLRHPELRTLGRPLRVLHIDGHGDEMGASSAPLPDEKLSDPKLPLFAQATVNDQRVGISAFNVENIQDGTIDAANFYVKSLGSEWGDEEMDGFCYRVIPKCVPEAGGTMLQLDLERETVSGNNIVPDAAIVHNDAMTPDVVEIDLDFFYYMEDPEKIARAIRKVVQMSRDAILIDKVWSPGWMDEGVAEHLDHLIQILLLSENEICELGRDRESLVSQVLSGLYDRYSALAERNVQENNLNIDSTHTLYNRFRRKGSKMAWNRTKQRDMERMRNILLGEDLFLRDRVDPKRTRGYHYYKRQEGDALAAERHSENVSELEVEQKLLPGFLLSKYQSVRELGGSFESFVTIEEHELIDRAQQIDFAPQQGRLLEAAKKISPADVALATIMGNLERNMGTMTEREVCEDLRLLLRVLKSDISDHPQAMRHSILAFFHAFGLETGLYEYRFHEFLSHLQELDNWSGRLTDLNGPYADAAFVTKMEDGIDSGEVTIFDVGSTLEIDGGGKRTMEICLEDNNGNPTTTAKHITFCFGMDDPSSQGAPELYAHAVVNGYVYLDADGHLYLPKQKKNNSKPAGFMQRVFTATQQKFRLLLLGSSEPYVEQGDDDEPEEFDLNAGMKIDVPAGVTRWRVLDRDIEGSVRRMRNSDAVSSQWQRASSTAVLPDGSFLAECALLHELHEIVTLARSTRKRATYDSDDMTSKSMQYLAGLQDLEKLYNAIQSWDFTEARRKLERLRDGSPLGTVLRTPSRFNRTDIDPAQEDTITPQSPPEDLALFLREHWSQLCALVDRVRKLYIAKDPTLETAITAIRPPRTSQIMPQQVEAERKPLLSVKRREFLKGAAITGAVAYAASVLFSHPEEHEETSEKIIEELRVYPITLDENIGFLPIEFHASADLISQLKTARGAWGIKNVFQKSFKDSAARFPKICDALQRQGNVQIQDAYSDAELSKMLSFYHLALLLTSDNPTQMEFIRGTMRDIIEETYRFQGGDQVSPKQASATFEKLYSDFLQRVHDTESGTYADTYRSDNPYIARMRHDQIAAYLTQKGFIKASEQEVREAQKTLVEYFRERGFLH